jgi:hypothetical protein
MYQQPDKGDEEDVDAAELIHRQAKISLKLPT